MGSSIFVDMSQLKVASTTWASLPIIPSTEREKEKIFELVAKNICTKPQIRFIAKKISFLSRLAHYFPLYVEVLIIYGISRR